MSAKGGSRLSEFQVHTTAIPARGVRQRAAAGMNLSPSGRLEANAAASEWLFKTAQTAFGDVSKCGILWGSNEVTGTVAGRLVPPETIGATPIRPGSKRGYLILYMSNVFIDRPGLQPPQPSWVAMSPRKDPKGDWFTIHLNLALATVRSRSAKASGVAARKGTPTAASAGADPRPTGDRPESQK